MSVKIPLPSDDQLPEAVRERLASMPPLNVFRMFANAPASFLPLVDFASTVLFGSQFDARKREIAILRTAHTTGSHYEWVQHVAVAKATGVTDEEIAAIGVDPVAGLDDEGRLLCRAADEIARDVRLSDESLAALLERYGVRETTELILCLSYFNMVSRFLESTRVELESDYRLEPGATMTPGSR